MAKKNQQDPHLRQRNLALLAILLGLAILFYFIAFVRMQHCG